MKRVLCAVARVVKQSRKYWPEGHSTSCTFLHLSLTCLDNYTKFYCNLSLFAANLWTTQDFCDGDGFDIEIWRCGLCHQGNPAYEFVYIIKNNPSLKSLTSISRIFFTSTETSATPGQSVNLRTKQQMAIRTLRS